MSTAFATARRLAPALLLPLALGGCAGTTARVRGGGAGMEAARLEPYNGPRARIAVAKFEDKTGKRRGGVGQAMATMLTTALVGTNRYIVLERDVLEEVIREQDLGAGGRVSAATAAPVGGIEGAELLVIGAVTAFEPEKMGVGGGIIGLGTLIGTAVLHSRNENIPIAAATYKESYVAIDLRVVDATTSRVLTTISVEGKGVDWGGGILGEVGGGRTRLPLAFGGFQKTATEQAVRTAIDVAVVELVRRTPAEYLRHEAAEFSGGRMLAFAYLDLPGLTGERAAAPGVRAAGSDAEWAALAAELGLSGAQAAPPVDFSVQRVAAVFAGPQPRPGAAVSIERVVGYPDRVEVTAALAPPPPDAAALKPTPALLRPMALVRLEQGPALKVTWKP